MYDVFYSFNILNTSFNIGFCITVKRLEQSWFVRYINVYYYYYYIIIIKSISRLAASPLTAHRSLFEIDLWASLRNIQILDVEHEKIRDSCQALFQPMPKLEEGLILRLMR